MRAQHDDDAASTSANPIARLGYRAAAIAQAVVPDPFIIAILLAVVTLCCGWLFGSGVVVEQRGIIGLASTFGEGMLNGPLIAFAFQMALILVTGYALADAPLVRRALDRVAGVPRTQASAAVVVSVVSMVLALLNWGLGLVGGAFLAREVGLAFARRGQTLNYPLVGAAGYVGLMVWHGGLSGSAPLTVATRGNFGEAIDVSQTLFSTPNLAITAALLVVVPLFFYALGKGPAPRAALPALEGERGGTGDAPAGVQRLENALVVTLLLALPIGVFLVEQVRAKGWLAVNLNSIILLFFVAGLLLHASPMGYARAFSSGAAGAAGILLQFPLYFGVLAVARDSGVLTALARSASSLAADGLGPLSTETSASWLTFVTAAVINLFVPSGGGQWALQAPIILDTAASLRLDRAPLVMAFSYGDQLTNMLQPFWALPLLSITGLKARDVLGYSMLVMCVATPVIFLGLALF